MTAGKDDDDGRKGLDERNCIFFLLFVSLRKSCGLAKDAAHSLETVLQEYLWSELGEWIIRKMGMRVNTESRVSASEVVLHRHCEKFLFSVLEGVPSYTLSTQHSQYSC